MHCAGEVSREESAALREELNAQAAHSMAELASVRAELRAQVARNAAANGVADAASATASRLLTEAIAAADAQRLATLVSMEFCAAKVNPFHCSSV